MRGRALFLGVVAVQIILMNQLIISWPDGLSRIIFCDVGQGDAILITSGFSQVLIDGGPDRKVLECLQQNIPFWDDSLDLVVATHPDADHIGGLPDVLNLYKTAIFLENGDAKDTEEYLILYDSVNEAVNSGTKGIAATIGQRLSVAQNQDYLVVFPQVERAKTITSFSKETETLLLDTEAENSLQSEDKNNANDLSIALILTLGDLSVFLPGDLEGSGEQALLSPGMLKEVDILKVGHHGAKTSTTRGLLGEIIPEKAVISSGLNNRYNHPSPEVVSNLVAIGATIYRTDQRGTVTFVTDGKRYWLQE